MSRDKTNYSRAIGITSSRKSASLGTLWDSLGRNEASDERQSGDDFPDSDHFYCVRGKDGEGNTTKNQESEPYSSGNFATNFLIGLATVSKCMGRSQKKCLINGRDKRLCQTPP